MRKFSAAFVTHRTEEKFIHTHFFSVPPTTKSDGEKEEKREKLTIHINMTRIRGLVFFGILCVLCEDKVFAFVAAVQPELSLPC